MYCDVFNLKRFLKAQNANDMYETALNEIRAGRKESHWMWYIFPQIDGLGHSAMSRKYSIKSLLEAKAYYFDEDTLGNRLREAIEAIPSNGDPVEIFGRVDAMKLRSCLTLFDLVEADTYVAEALDYFFEGKRCKRTIDILAAESAFYHEDDIFRRYGIYESPRAFIEGWDGSEELTYANRVGTILDLFRRGETMRSLFSRYFWVKPFDIHRIPDSKNRMIDYMRFFIEEVVSESKDATFPKDAVELFNRCHVIPYENIFELVDTCDAFWKKCMDDPSIKPVFDSCLKESLCKPMM